MTERVEQDFLVLAPPADVFELLTVADRIVEWQGTRVVSDPRPGGQLRVLLAGRYPQVGAYVDVEPHHRLTLRVGWDMPDASAKDSIGLEYHLTPEQGGRTRLVVIHRDVPSEKTMDTRLATEHYLARLAVVAAGGTVPGDRPLNEEPGGSTGAPGTVEWRALSSSVAELFVLMDGLHDADWRLPTRCAPLNVSALVAHVSGSFAFVETWLAARADGPARLDRSSMWRAFPTGTAQEVVDVATPANDWAPADVLAGLRRTVDSFMTVASRRRADDVAACPMFGDGFALPVVEVLANRVLEVAVHLLDLQAALGRAERLPVLAERIVGSILDGLLGDCRPQELNWDVTTYARKGTGRAPLTATERTILGEARAATFPLLA